MKMTFEVTYVDGRTFVAKAMPKDLVAYERQYSTTVAAMDDSTTPMEHIFYLAWSPLHRAGIEPGTFDEFLDRLDDVEMQSEPAVDPTQPAPSDEPSPASPPEAA